MPGRTESVLRTGGSTARLIGSALAVFVAAVLGWFFILPYFRLMFSPISWSAADLNKNGFISPDEADYVADYGMKQYSGKGQKCTEYYALKDGLAIEKTCK